jgi:uncharacterized membrane protein
MKNPSENEMHEKDEITSDDRIWAAVSYLFSPLAPVCIHLMPEKRGRPFIRAHYPQAFVSGFILFLFGIPLAVFSLGCTAILWLVLPLWAYRAYCGEMIRIPFVSEYIQQKGWGKIQ